MRRPLSLLLPFVLLLLLVPGLAAVAAADDAGATTDAARAEATPVRAAFGRLKALAGEWRGKSTRGWTDVVSFQVLGGEAAVLQTSRFDGAEAEPMATVFHLDGERLLLTHYCMAGSQPRMEATEISPDGREITFTFLDATNLASRDVGHMDKAVYVLRDDDHYSTRWTWYKDGQERWLEEVEVERAAAR